MADARHVQLARELAERDARIATELAELETLRADVEELRAHAEALSGFRAAYPAEQERLREAVNAAREELHAREAEVTAAAEELAHTKGDRQAEARRALNRASTVASAALGNLTRLEDERETLEADAARSEDELPRLQQRADDLAARAAATPRATAPPPPSLGLDPIADWASRARAALFVAAASLESDREQVIREASELTAAALGEGSITSVEAAAARIARAAGEGS
jgi:hypothetical protein